MLCISVEEFLFWKKRQLSKGGDRASFAVLLDCIGGITTSDLNLKSINPRGNIHLKKNLEFLESVWDNHLQRSCPIQYLCGITFWRDLKLKVTNKVLIPRPETELIVDIVFNIFRKKSEKLFFAELGTGSGAISIALALAYPFSHGVATDIDQEALKIATKNYINSSKQSNLKFYCGNWWSPLESFKGKLDLAVSNPPYIPKDTYKKLPIEVKNFEPKVALLGRETSSANTARERLQLVLAHDRVDMSSLTTDLLDKMRKEILDVVAKYVEIDFEEVAVSLETEDRMTALVANLPIKRTISGEIKFKKTDKTDKANKDIKK